jgi:SAM-dependent methyltransferase/predicted O-methyltransferase YrrM
MAHPEQLDYIKFLKEKFPEFFKEKKVLEIGSLNINGSIRDFFENCDYIGLDLEPGKDVDIICEGQNYDANDESFDVVSSTECFEHNPYWKETFLNMIRMCKSDGLVFFTCATDGREEHGTEKYFPELSQFTLNKGWNYYRNLNQSDFDNLNLDQYFTEYKFFINHRSKDLYFYGIKRKKINVIQKIVKNEEKFIPMLNYKNEKKTEKTINVFYHFYVPDTNNMWVWWIDEQMSLLKTVGLVDKAKINMCMTIPLGLYNSKTGHSYDEMVIGYIKDRYPFVNIIDIQPVGAQPNLYEGQTLAKMYEHCLQEDGYVFYFHNKGMSSYSTHIPGAIKDWRHYMQYFNVEKWEDCVAKLDEGYDCCGVDWVERHDIKLDFVVQHYAGNFWWARNDYIRKLKHPLKIEEYMDVEAMMRELQNYRYCFELWMATGIPKQHCFHYRRHHQYDNQGLERYFTYYPPEMYRDDVEVTETSYTRNRLDVLMEVGSKNLFNWRDHRQFADWIIRRKQPTTTVDLGVDYGYSTFCFAIPEIGDVYGIDSFEGDICAGERDTYEYVTDKVKELELTNVSIIKGFFDDVAKTWNKPIDILHIDGLHTYEAVKNDFEKWVPFLKEDGIILMHDTMVDDPKFGVSRFFKEINLPKTNFGHCNGLGVVSRDINLISEIKKNFGEFIHEI